MGGASAPLRVAAKREGVKRRLCNSVSRDHLVDDMPADVGEAIVAWLQHGRPAGRPCPCVFTRVRAPFGSLSAGAVSAIVRNACQRAGLPAMGAHRLRHTAATQMLQAGASLGEVGQILRHRSMNTTSIYAKVDRRALVALVRPWPGDAA